MNYVVLSLLGEDQAYGLESGGKGGLSREFFWSRILELRVEKEDICRNGV
jgi:hypothetical protein